MSENLDPNVNEAKRIFENSLNEAEQNRDFFIEFLKTPIEAIEGIGKTRKFFLNNVGIFKVRDLLLGFPRSFLRESNNLFLGESILNIRVLKKYRAGRFFRLLVQFNEVEITFIFFNIKTFNLFFPGKNYKVLANIYEEKGKYYATQPKLLNYFKSVFPIYAGNVAHNLINKIVNQLIQKIPFTEKIYNDLSLKETLFNLHNGELLEKSLDVLKYLEATIFIKIFKEKKEGQPIFIQETFREFLPFKPNEEQEKAIFEIKQDLYSKKELRRLIFGEVGSGKTLIAFSIAFGIVEQNFRVALLAPTTALAMQHAEWIIPLFEKVGKKAILLVSDLKKKRKVKESIACGEFDLIIGTHALLYQEIPNLGLVIIDEMQRFGVLQRANLLEKSTVKNLLMLSATPIPRSLNLMFSNFMDFSILEKSVFEKNLETFIVSFDKKTELISKLAQLKEKFFWVLPCIEDTDEWQGVISRAQEIEQSIKNVRILHGKMKDQEKLEIISQFREGKIIGLITTTVIETGIDIPDANIIVIENASQFGLSQLHQLRGRVGRAGQRSKCILLYLQYSKRLKILKENLDGFVIAQKDLELRGAGEWVGTMQHGLRNFSFLNLPSDTSILNQAKKNLKDFPESILFASSEEIFQ